MISVWTKGNTMEMTEDYLIKETPFGWALCWSENGYRLSPIIQDDNFIVFKKIANPMIMSRINLQKFLDIETYLNFHSHDGLLLTFQIKERKIIKLFLNRLFMRQLKRWLYSPITSDGKMGIVPRVGMKICNLE